MRYFKKEKTMRYFLFSLLLCVNIYAQKDGAKLLDMGILGGGTTVYAMDLDGSTEYAQNTSPTNLDLNDTMRTVYTIDHDFELGAVLEDDFTSDITGWTGLVSGVIHYDGDWNSIGRVNVLQDSATGTASPYIKSPTFTDLTDGVTYRLSYRYYIPSSNTTTAGIIPQVRNTISTLTERTVTDSWTYVTEDFISPVGAQTTVRFFQSDGAAGTTVTVGDIIYIDDFSLTSFPSYTATGNHSFDSSSANGTKLALTGTYSGMIVSVIDTDNHFSNGDFATNTTGWSGGNSTVKHYGNGDGDWNGIGGANLPCLLDSATNTSLVQVNQAMTPRAGSYRLSYKYYIPSGNTTTAGIRPRSLNPSTR
jgi:hypothetical protein